MVILAWIRFEVTNGPTSQPDLFLLWLNLFENFTAQWMTEIKYWNKVLKYMHFNAVYIINLSGFLRDWIFNKLLIDFLLLMKSLSINKSVEKPSNNLWLWNCWGNTLYISNPPAIHYHVFHQLIQHLTCFLSNYPSHLMIFTCPWKPWISLRSYSLYSTTFFPTRVQQTFHSQSHRDNCSSHPT